MESICAIATPLGLGGISIIRVTGMTVIDDVNDYFKVNLHDLRPNEIKFTHFIENGRLVDEIMVSKIVGPRSYTGFDTVEINCHGGVYVTKRILEILIKDPNVRLAEKGEFVKLSVANGKQSIQHALSINDLVEAKTEKTYLLSRLKVEGKGYQKLEDLRMVILDLLSHIDGGIDYPEYEEIGDVDNDEFSEKLGKMLSVIDKIVNDSKIGEVYKNGITTAIIGQPNVGKSSLLNALSRKDKAIVTDIEGTTRDVIESHIEIDGLELKLLDTAGIRHTDDVVEKIGVEKSRKLFKEAQLVLFVVDGTREMTEIELELISESDPSKTVLVVNKCDLEHDFDFNFENKVFISALNNDGIEEIGNILKKVFKLEDLDFHNGEVVNDMETIAKLELARESLMRAIDNLEAGFSQDIVSIELKEVLFIVDKILGIEVENDVLDNLFSNFCLGK